MSDFSEDRFYLELLRAYIDSANDAIFVLCDEMKFLVCNRRMEEWLGASERELTEHNARIPITDLIGEEAEEKFTRSFQEALLGKARRFEAPLQPRQGKDRWAEIQLNRVNLDAGMMVIGVARDITERRLRHSLLEWQMTHDQLTDLPNWNYLRERIGAELARLQEESGSLAVLIVGVDRFREVNNTLGHIVGDQVLQEVARRLQQVIDDSGFIARQGGDEFAVMLPGMKSEPAQELAKRVRRALLEPVQLSLSRGMPVSGNSMDLDLGFSIGVACAPLHAQDTDDLLRCGGVALQQARNRPDGIVLYQADRDAYVPENLLLMGELRRAIELEQLLLFYQPIVSLRDEAVAGFEALVRWQHPERGMLLPDQFIPMAERTGMVRALDTWVLYKAMQQLKQWSLQGRLYYLSVNVSPRTLEDPRFFEAMQIGLQALQIEPRLLRLEITENCISHEPEHHLTILDRIARLGVSLSIDDYGTGYSSLAYLHRFPVQQLKIDKSFVQRMLVNDHDAVIVRSTIEMSHSMGLSVVAEGVELQPIAEQLRAWGCEYAQGWFYGRPQAVEYYMQPPAEAALKS